MNDEHDDSNSSELTTEELQIDANSIEALQDLCNAIKIPVTVKTRIEWLDETDSEYFSFSLRHDDVANALTAVQLSRDTRAPQALTDEIALVIVA